MKFTSPSGRGRSSAAADDRVRELDCIAIVIKLSHYRFSERLDSQCESA